MTQPLNYTPKAIADLLSYPCTSAPMAAAGNRYIANKLREAQVFVLSDHGQLLDRSKPRPEVPGAIFRPAFPVVALEYSARDIDWHMGPYTECRSSRRIALAWEWKNDLPAELRPWVPDGLGEGVVVAAICFYDDMASWVVVPVAMHIGFEETWTKAPEVIGSPFRAAMIENGRLSKAQQNAPAIKGAPIALSPEAVVGIAMQAGGPAAALDLLAADTMDEVNAYTDLCFALACANVRTIEHPAPAALNRNRIKAGKLPLKGFHVLELSGGGEMPAGGSGDRAAARSHLRRGHIRRLSGDRVTWVNSTIVRGRGFIEKVYAA